MLFEDRFAGEQLDAWRADQGWSIVVAPGGGRCAQMVSSGDFEDLILADQVPIIPGHPIAVYWRARQVSGAEAPYLRVDFLDEQGKPGGPYARQEPSRTGDEWTENAMLVSDWFPAYTRAITIHFHLGPNTNTTAMIGDVRIVDLAQAADELVRQELAAQTAGLEQVREQIGALPQSQPTRRWTPWLSTALARAERQLRDCEGLEPGSQALTDALEPPTATTKRLAEATAALQAGDPALLRAEALLVYRTTPITSTMVLPYTAELPGTLTDRLELRACAGEVESASLVLWAPEKTPGLLLRVADLQGPGGTIPAAQVDLKWVKCWFQAGSAPHGVGQDRSHKVLVPELLLNDDALVRVDLTPQLNLLRLSFPAGPKYTDINGPANVPWGWRATLSEFPVRDADELQPLDLEPACHQQVWITVHVPEGIRPGTYRGTLTAVAAQETKAEIALEVEVLPFALVPPRTHYDLSQDFTGSLYYWGELDPTGAGSIGYKVTSEEQFRAELRHMFAHNTVAPAMVISPEVVYGNEPLFRRTLELMRETGMSGRPLYFADSGMIGAPTGPAELDRLRQNVAQTIRLAREYGFTEVYFYGLDEATGDRLRTQRTAWPAVHEAGGRVIVSGFRGQFEAVGDLLDLCNWAGPPDPAQPPLWHGAGHKLWNYANPQTPVEDPAVYRRSYGLVLWKADYDGACTYCYMDSSGTPWNDLDCDSYRDHNVAYPTTNGIVPTLALEGFREGLDDVKYATVLRLAVDEALRTDSADAQASAAQAAAWLDGLDPATADLDAARAEMIRWIIRLR